nr:MAG TPA: hypothetical protein [Caudoviricetes sp.]
MGSFGKIWENHLLQINQNFGRFRLPERVHGLVEIPGSISSGDVPRVFIT